MNAAGIAVAGGDAAQREASDAELVSAVRTGDDAAFAELYRRYQPAVARFVWARVGDYGRAEDVAQEAFVSALRRLRQTDSEIAFRAWIFEIARNATIDLYRRSSRAEEISMDAPGGLGPADAGRLAAGSGPDASLLRSESFDHLRGALDELSATHLRVIVLRELEGRSYREIGEHMDLSQAAVESTLFRARRKLEHEYEQLDSGRTCSSIGAAIGRLAEGLESDRDRLRLDRHAQRCSACRRRARQLGIEPLLGRRRRMAARAAAFLPLPAFLRHRVDSAPVANRPGFTQSAGQVGTSFGPALEIAGGVAGKTVAMVAAAALIGGSGAALGGAGPRPAGADRQPSVESAQPERAAERARAPRKPRPSERITRRMDAPDRIAGTVPKRLRTPVGGGPAVRRTQSAPDASPPRPAPTAPASPLPSLDAGHGAPGTVPDLSVPPQPVLEQPAPVQLGAVGPAAPVAPAPEPFELAEGTGATLSAAATAAAPE